MASKQQKRRAVSLVEALEARRHLAAQQIDGFVGEGWLFSPQKTLSNVTVFADANANGAWDEGEASTLSDDAGFFGLFTETPPELIRAVAPDGYVFNRTTL